MAEILMYLPYLAGMIFFYIWFVILRNSSKKWAYTALIFIIVSTLVVSYTINFNGAIGYLAHIFSNFWVWLTLIFWIVARYVKRNWIKISCRVLSIIFFIVTIFTVILDLLVDYNIIVI